jgi:hypothetical protein
VAAGKRQRGRGNDAAPPPAAGTKTSGDTDVIVKN